MPGKTQNDRLLELEKIVPGIEKHLELIAEVVKALGIAHEETKAKFGDLRLDFETTVVVLKKEIEDFKKWKEEQKKGN